MNNAEIKIAPLSAFHFDTENANKGTPRGKELLKKSLKKERAGRSIVAAADGTILCGNKTLAAAQEVGFKNAKVVESTGEDLIIHVRTDIPNSKTKEARRIALGDNRIGEISLNFDNQILGSFAKFDESILEEFWSEEEIKQKLAFVDKVNGTRQIASDKSNMIKEQFQVLIEDLTEEQQRNLLQQLNDEGYKCRALIS